MTEACPRPAIDQPAAYRILVLGWVSVRWEDWFEGMHIEHRGGGESDGAYPDEAANEQPSRIETTLLTGMVPDQAALLGMLQRLYAFGLPILRVERIPPVVQHQAPG